MNLSDSLAHGPTDGSLLQEFAEERVGSSFRTVYDRHRPFVFQKCIRAFRGNRELAEDACQTVFVVLSMKAASLIDYDDVGGWLSRTASFTVANMLRREQMRARTIEEYTQEVAGDVCRTSGISVGTNTDMKETLETELGRLPAKQREVVESFYLRSMTVEHIAELTHSNPQTVRSRIRLACEKLRKGLERRGVVLSMATLTAVLEAEGAEVASSGGIVPWIDDAPQSAMTTPEEVVAEMDRAAAKTMWGKIGAVAAGLATIGVGTALVVSHLQNSESATSWRIESVIGNPSVRRGETMQTLKAGVLLCNGDTIMTSSNQEVQVASDAGDRILVREDSELGFRNLGPETVGEGRAWASSPRRRVADLPLHLARGAVVAQVKHPTCLATQHAKMNTDIAEFFLMVASGLTSNSVPWSFSRLDVTGGQVYFRSSETQVSTFEVPVSLFQFAAAGTDHEGEAIETVARKSDGRELSTKHGGVFFREYVDLYAKGSYGLDRLSQTTNVPSLTLTGRDLFKRLKRTDAKLDARVNEVSGILEIRNGSTNEIEAMFDLSDVALLGSTNGVVILSSQRFRQIGETASTRFGSTCELQCLNLADLPRMRTLVQPSRSDDAFAEDQRVLLSCEVLPVGASAHGHRVYEMRTSWQGRRIVHYWEVGTWSSWGMQLRCVQMNAESLSIRELTRSGSSRASKNMDE